VKPAAKDGIEINETQDGLIVYDETTDRVHHLNQTAAVILQLCDGTLTVEEITTDIARMFELDQSPAATVEACLAQLEREGLVDLKE
jgi:PqqD family protein of HPr-rel-A system